MDRVYLYGTHRSLFEVNADNEIVFKGTAKDFEAMPADFSLSLQVVTVNGETGRPTTHTLKNVVVRVADVDEAPTGLTVTGVTDQINEGEYASGVRLAEIVVEDDALGTNTLAALPAGSPFEYRAVTELDREELDTLVAGIAVEGTALAATHTLRVLDVNDTDPVIVVGGSRVSLREGVYGDETDTGIRLTVTDADLNDHGPTLHTHFGQTFSGGAANSSGLHTVNGWSRIFTMTGKADVEGDAIVWSLKNGSTDKLKVSENGEVWLATASMSAQKLNVHFGFVVATVGNYSSDAYLVVSYGALKPYLSEEDSDTEAGEERGQEGDSGESDSSGDGKGEDGDDDDDDEGGDGSNPDSAVGPATAFFMEDGYF